MKSIKSKLIIMYLAMVFIVMIVSGTFMLSFNRTQNISKSRQELESYARIINDQIIQVYTVDQLQEGFDKIDYSSGYSLSSLQGHILNTKGQAIASSVKTLNFYRSSVVVSAAAGKADFNSGRRETDASTGLWREWMEYASPVSDETGEVKYIIYVRADASPIRSSMGEMAGSFFITAVIALVLGAVMGYLFANTLTDPIRMLTKISKDMAQGNLNQEIPVNSDDEIGQLTQSFNDMAQALSLSMANVTSEKNKMEIILHNMTDGLLAYDARGSLIHANHACHELLVLDDIEEFNFSQLIEKLSLYFDPLENLAPGIVKEYTLEMEDRYVSAIFTTYSNTYGRLEGIVIVLRDITQLKRLDNMRKQFVANVSHELRTPLTTIKSYTETLLDGALEQKEIAEEFLEVINSESDRMTLLVRDLLELSRYDSGQLILELTDANLIDLIKENIRQNQLAAINKNQQIVFNPDRSQLMLRMDIPRINQVLTNIISNAIKYSYEKSTIQISLEDNRDRCRVIIKDNGMGIPRKELEHIFERFYRVDKARSRAMGGTGLGLAIAKEIMDAHGGSISAESVLNKGTSMIITFNKNSEKLKEC